MSTFITYEGDNLAIMRELPSETIDLIYIDPPYFSQRNYGDFDDRWKSMQHYLEFMVERLKEMHRLLKPTGSIYVHLDWHAVHYVKVEMDKMFGVHNFQNEIVWCYETAGKSKKSFSKKHDTILFYSKSLEYTFNAEKVLIPRKQTHLKNVVVDGIEYGEKVDKKSGKVYRWNLNIGRLPFSYWIDIPAINGRAHKTRVGYQTQKPAELMERIILASSNEGDSVADFFCGSGSFIKKAHELGRSCIGVDVSPKALYLARSPTKRAPDVANAAAKKQVRHNQSSGERSGAA